jgi:hypothetical protein
MNDPIRFILSLLADTTPGEWEAEAIGSEGYVIKVKDASIQHTRDYGLWVARVFDGKWKQLKANAVFIAEAHNMIPRLTQRITTLEQENEVLRRRS